MGNMAKVNMVKAEKESTEREERNMESTLNRAPLQNKTQNSSK